VHDSKLDHSIMKRHASSRKGNSGAAKAEARLKLPDWYAKAELLVSAAGRPSTKPHSQKIEKVWSMRKIRGF
jgi:hypothetical protein